MAVIGQKVVFEGQVQGVGFRRQTFELSKRFSVTGYVRNLPNGSVEVVMEGEPEELARFLETLKEKLAAYIESYNVSSMSPQQHSNFSIHF